MKRILRKASVLLMASAMLLAYSCSDDNTNEGGGNGDGGNGGTTEVDPLLFENGTQLGNGDAEYEFKGKYTLKKGTYLMKGWIYVTEGSELTIEPGTVIKGDKETKASLIVERGGKLIAQGTASEPIVFTSEMEPGNRRPGDWGGIILCGRAKNNKTVMQIEGGPRSEHGGDNDADNSGVLSYVRVEFAGYPFNPDEEINGVTFGSVGSGTKVDHVQVSYCNDDSFEWFGGCVNAQYLIAYHGWDDEFDTDNGYSGKVQYALSVRNPRIADTSVSNGFESDNNADGAATSPFTSAVFSNVTFVGPIGQDPSFMNESSYINAGDVNPNNGSKLGQFQAAMQVRRNSRLSCFNSVAMGYPVGVIIENDKGSTTQDWATNGLLKLRNIYFAQMTILGSDKNKSFVNESAADPSQPSFSATFFQKPENNNTVLTNISDLMLRQPNSLQASPNYGPVAGSPLVGKTGLFTDPMLSGFEEVDYIGAFKSDSDADNWTLGWAEFDPQNKVY